MDKQNVKNLYELTPLQEGILFHALHDTTSRAYFEQSHQFINGHLDFPLYEKTWQELVKRHDILRTLFIHKNTPQPLQIVLKNRPINIQLTDLTHLSADEQIHHIQHYKEQDKKNGFDLAKEPLLRIHVFQCASDRTETITSFHHIILDGWSGNLLSDEFVEIYQAFKQKQRIDLPPPPSFNLYVKWLKTQDKTAARYFWENYLKNYQQLASIPRQSTEKAGFIRATLEFQWQIPENLITWTNQQKITLSTLPALTWGLLLSQHAEKQDITFGMTVSGRPPAINQIEKMVGLFINTIPIRLQINQQDTLTNLAQTLQNTLNDSKSYDYYALADIQANSQLKTGLFDHILVIENYPSTEKDNINLGFEIIKTDFFDFSNYDLTLQCFLDSQQLHFHLIYNQAVYPLELMQKIQEQWLYLLQLLAENPTISFAEIIQTPLFYAQTQQTKNKTLPIGLAATFTAEPLAPYLEEWGKIFKLPFSIEFAPYNQIFQSLLDKNSSLNQSSINILLIRLIDSLREFTHSTPELTIAHLNQVYQQLIDLLKIPRPQTTLIVDLPFATETLEPTVATHLIALQQTWRTFIQAQAHLRLIDGLSLPTLFYFQPVFDTYQDKVGHIPFTDEYYAALGTVLARCLVSQQQSEFKVIVLDCDNTLWQGVCGEEGTLGVKITNGHQALQRLLLEKQAAGFLLCLCSKNNPADVWAVFEQHPDMLLKREHILTARINWQPKSQNLHSLAKELNLGLNSFIFLDDSGVECSEVMTHCPEVLTLQLPANNSDSFPELLAHLWALDKFIITQEDRQRNRSYQAEQQRQQEEEQATSLVDFLAQLAIRVSFSPLRPAQIERVAQLTQRTNQFNLSTRRRTEQEIKTLLNQENTQIWTVEVIDRFGEYGLVGVIISEMREQSVWLDTFLLSCRALGRNVETAILVGLKRFYAPKGINTFFAEYRQTAKNQPILDFLQQSGWNTQHTEAENSLFQLDIAQIPTEAPYVTLQFTPFTQAAPSPDSVTPSPSHTPLPVPTSENRIKSWDFTQEIPENLRHQAYYAPLRYASAQALLRLPATVHISPPTEYAPAENTLQIQLVKIWETVLAREPIGINDNFFELGGHSLKATRIIAMIYKQLGIDLPLPILFQYPTIATLSAHITNLQQQEKQIYTPIPNLAPQSHYALSHAQRRLWILQQMEKNSFAYNNFSAFRLKGCLNLTAFTQAWQYLLQRHEVLRTYFVEENGEIVQKIQSDLDFNLIIIDLKNLINPESAAWKYAEKETRHSFSLEQAPLMRVTLIQTTENTYFLLINIHHIISDGWSFQIMVEDILQTYSAFLAGKLPILPALRIHYKDFAAWQNQSLKNAEKSSDSAYWLQQFAGELPVLNLSTDFPRPPVQTFNGCTIEQHLTLPSSDALSNLLKTEKVSLFMFLISLINILLYRHTGQTDLIIGTPIAGRDHPDTQEQIGFYVNTLALRNRLNPTQSFTDLLADVKENTLAAYQHAYYPFDRLIDELRLTRDISHAALFDVMVILQNHEFTYNSSSDLAELQIESLPLNAPISRFDLTFEFYEMDNGLQCLLTYNSDLFLPNTIKQWLARLETLLHSIFTHSAATIATLPLLPTEEYKLLQEFSHTYHPYTPTTLVALFEQQVLKTPTHIAVLSPELSLTYAELNAKANQVADFLHKQGKTGIIGLLCERSVALIPYLLGIMKANCVYLPIDRVYPASRIAYFQEHSDCALLDLTDLDLSAYSSENLSFKPKPQDLAYIIYTSGSTGQPKGVMIEHVSFCNMILDQIRVFQISPADRVLQFSSPSFDASLSEIFMALLSGATLVTVSSEVIEDSYLFYSYLKRYAVTVATLPTVYLNALPRSAVKGLKTLITAGEAAIVDDACYFARYLRYFNAYGPTEVSVCSSYHQVNPAEKYDLSIPIGRPVANLNIWLLDEYLQPVPVGYIGEIAIGGIGLARGYLNDEKMNMQKFISHPLNADEKIYLTGDLGKWRVDGLLEFCGRKDEQVKIRGFRIEITEIMYGLLRHPAISEACVLALGETNKQLVAYVVLAEPLSELTDTLQAHLRLFLPAYMLPTVFIEVNRLPLTVQGKIDKRVLAALYVPSETVDYVAPRTQVEAFIVDCWEKVLGQTKISIFANFFVLGGDSIRAVQVVTRLRQVGLEVETKTLFLHPTPAQLAIYAKPLLPSLSTSAAQDVVTGFVPLTAIQRWFFDSFQKDAHHFNHSDMLFAAQGFEAEAVQQAVEALRRHHDALRLGYAFAVNGEITQFIADLQQPLHFSCIDVSEVDDFISVINQKNAELQCSFDLQQGNLLRVALFKHSQGDYLLFTMHHLVADAVSWRILLEDFTTAYAQALVNKTIDLPAKTCSFQAWALAIQAYSASADLLAQRTYWQTIADAPVQYLTPKQEGLAPLQRCVVAHRALSVAETKRLLTTAYTYYQAGVTELLLTALNHGLQQQSAGHILITLESHGRTGSVQALDVSRTVGWFTSAYPFLLPPLTATLVEDVQQIQSFMRALPTEGGTGYGILNFVTPSIYTEGWQLRATTQLSFNYLGQYDADVETPYFTRATAAGLEDYSVSPQARMLHELECNVLVLEHSLQINLLYCPEQYEPVMIENLLETMHATLQALLAALPAHPSMTAATE